MDEHAGVQGGMERGEKVRGTAAEWENWTGRGGALKRRKAGGIIERVLLFSI